MRRLPLTWILLLIMTFPACNAGNGEVRPLTILHVNDLHARFLPDERGRGGFAHLATAIQRERANSEAALVLNAGDLVQGTPVSSIYEGMPCFEVANAMGFDAFVLGNHEFDYTWKKIPEFAAAANFPVITANVVNDAGELLAPEAYIMVERNGIRIAIIGVLLENLGAVTKGDQTGPYKLLPAAETVRKYARRVRDDVDLIIVLGHLFDEEEMEILEGVPEVDVLIDGHNHRGQQTANVVDGRIGVKNLAYGRELGRLDLQVDTGLNKVVSHSWKRIPIRTRDFPADAEVQRLVDKWEGKVASLVDVRIGRATRSFDRQEVMRLIEEAMKDAAGADFAYMNAGGTRDVIHEGDILVRHIWQVLPFGNQLVWGRLKGRDVPKSFTDGRRLNPDATYVVATNDYIADRMSGRAKRGIKQSGPLVREAVIDYIKGKKVLR